MSGSWVTNPRPHECDLPFTEYGFPDGEFGALWRCGECKRLWSIEQPVLRLVWKHAPWWLRIRYWGKK